MSDSFFDRVFSGDPEPLQPDPAEVAQADAAPAAEAAVEAVAEQPVEQQAEAAAPAPVERVDWKERAIREEEQRKALERQLEQFKVAPPQQQAQPEAQPRGIPNPATDPAGYHRFIEEQTLNHRLNMSEMMAREKYPDLDEMVPKFQAAAEKDPSLKQQLYAHPHPYDWAYKEMKRREGLAEIGDDPAAWREREREKLRAELAAEGGQQQEAAPRPVRPQLPPNLTGRPNAAERGAPAFNGYDFNTFFPDIPTIRSRAN